MNFFFAIKIVEAYGIEYIYCNLGLLDKFKIASTIYSLSVR